MKTAEEILKAEIIAHLPSGFSAEKLCVFGEVTSTNDIAKSMAQNGAKSGTCVIATSQNQGRGRHKRAFFAPNGGLYMSIILRPQINLQDCTKITAAAAVCVCRALEKLGDMAPQIKWVNDVFLGEKKICGILTEAEISANSNVPKFIILGIGVNIKTPNGGFPKDLPNAGAIDKNISIAEVAAKIILETADITHICTQNQTLLDYKNRCFIIGNTVCISSAENKAAKVLGITENYALEVEYETGEIQTISAGECSVKI